MTDDVRRITRKRWSLREASMTVIQSPLRAAGYSPFQKPWT